MNTFILQYFYAGHWRNYVANNKSRVEFLTMCHAYQVGMDLAHYHHLATSGCHHWRIMDSTGKALTLDLIYLAT